MSDHAPSNIYRSQLFMLDLGLSEFVAVVENVNKDFKNGKIGDWPLTLLTNVLFTSVISLLKILPESKTSNQNGDVFDRFIDRRTIATLVRNIIDTHDTLEFLCSAKDWPDVNGLNRDILMYYVSDKIFKIRKDEVYRTITAKYWEIIIQKMPEANKKDALKKAQSLFYESKRDRLNRICGENADFVGDVIADLSTYVHSIPVGLWDKDVETAFLIDKHQNDILGVWLKIGNFFFARCINIVLGNLSSSTNTEGLNKFLDYNKVVFHPKK